MTATRPLDLIGHTPLVALERVDLPPGVKLFAKLEGQNPTGSIKDRIARRLVLHAEAEGHLRPGMTLVEASTGNTGIALAMVAKQRGYKAHIVLPHGVVPAVPQILTALDATMSYCEPEAGTRGAIAMAGALAAADPNTFAVRQFSHPLNVTTHYEETGAEIVQQIDHVDVFVAGIGTGGTIMGVGRRLREAFPEVRIVGLEPHLGDYLQGLRRLEDAFAAPLLSLDALDGRWIVTAADSIAAAKHVCEREGLFVGVSSGATLHIALKEAAKLRGGGNIVVMFSDGGWKYLPATPWDAATSRDPRLDNVHWW